MIYPLQQARQRSESLNEMNIKNSMEIQIIVETLDNVSNL